MVDEFVLPCLPAIVLDVWKIRKEDVFAQRKSRTSSSARLVEAFIYPESHRCDNYKDQLDKLNEAMALTQATKHAQRAEELEIEAVLGFAERFP